MVEMQRAGAADRCRPQPQEVEGLRRLAEQFGGDAVQCRPMADLSQRRTFADLFQKAAEIAGQFGAAADSGRDAGFRRVTNLANLGQPVEDLAPGRRDGLRVERAGQEQIAVLRQPPTQDRGVAVGGAGAERSDQPVRNRPAGDERGSGHDASSAA